MPEEHRSATMLLPGLAFTVVVALTLIVGAWVAYGQIEKGFEEQLQRRLEGYAATAAASMQPRPLEQLPSGDDPVARLYRNRLQALHKATGVKRIAVLRRDGSLVIDTQGGEFGSRDYGLAENANELEACFSAGTLSTIPYRDDEGTLYRIAFSPVLDREAEVSDFAVAVEIEADYDERLAAVRNAMIGAVAIVFMITLAAALAASRAMVRVQRELQRQTRLAELAQFSAGMAHQIKNPLAALRGYVELLARGLADPGQKQIADKLISEIGALDRVVRDFLQFSRGSRGSVEKLTLEQALRPVVESARHAGGEGVQVVCDNLPAVELELDTTALREALGNVAVNAAEAMKDDGGNLAITAEVRGSEVRVELADSGPGIPAEIAAKLFQPFTTGKADGTGLGLAIARRMLRDLGGDLELVRTGPSGTMFRATFLKESGL